MEKDTIVNIVFLLAGIAMIIWRKQYTRFIIESQNRVWGYKFGNREIRATKFVIILVGTGFIVSSLLALFGLIHFR